MRYASHLADLVGNTPLVRLNDVAAGTRATVLAKVEYLNPGGSAKDRIAARIISAINTSDDARNKAKRVMMWLTNTCNRLCTTRIAT